jgi:hypothetical protein
MTLKMSPEEKVFLSRMVSFSGKDISVIRDVMRSLLHLFTTDFYAGEKSTIIPYIGSVKVNLIDSYSPAKGSYTKINLKMEPSASLIEDLTAVNEGNWPPSGDFFKKSTESNLEKILEIDESMEIDV